jgi:hypothetical protein
MSYSRWLGELIRSSSDWPPEIRRLVGSAPDFPLREEPGKTKGVDIPRVALDD